MLINQLLINLFLNNLSLGAIHDEQAYYGEDARSCPESNNNIMVSQSGFTFKNIPNILTFSKCSIQSFKKILLTSEKFVELKNFLIMFLSFKFIEKI